MLLTENLNLLEGLGQATAVLRFAFKNQILFLLKQLTK